MLSALSGERTMLEDHVRNYMEVHHPNEQASELIEHLFEKGESWGIEDNGLLLVHVIFGIEYNLWYNRVGLAEMTYAAVVGPHGVSEWVQKQAIRSADRKAIGYTLTALYGSIWQRLKNHFLSFLGKRKKRPRTARWYRKNIRKVRDSVR